MNVGASIRVATSAVDPDEARRRAARILTARRYKPEKLPAPLTGVLRWIGDRLSPLVRWLDPVGRFFLTAPGLVLAAAGLVVITVLVVLRVAARRGPRGANPDAGRPPRGVERSLDPDELERTAESAERAGDYQRAVRLRFRAGLLRLDDAGAIAFRPSITSGQVSRTLRRSDFDALAVTFDSVAYGNRAARPEDARAARDEWPRLLREVARR